MALDIDFLMSYDKESLKAELRRIAKVTGKRTLSRADIDQYGRVSSGAVVKKFGTLYDAHKAAGLVPGIFKKVTDRELLRILVDLWTITDRKFGRSPSMPEVRKYGFPVVGQTIALRFGTWKKALVAASKIAAKLPTPEIGKVERKKIRKVERGTMSVRKRFLVFHRDRYTCRMCKRGGGELQVDHVIPLCRGGSNRMDNLQTLCKDCNMGKGGNLE